MSQRLTDAELAARRERELDAIVRIVRAGAEMDSERLIPELLAIITEATASDAASLWMIEGGQLVMASAYGHRVEELKAKYARMSLATTTTGRATIAVEPRAMPVDELPLPVRADLAAVDYRELAILPLHIDRRPAGTLDLVRTSARPYTNDEIGTASLLANQIAIQIERAKLYVEARRQVRLLALSSGLARIAAQAASTEDVIDQLIGRAAAALPADTVTVSLLSEGSLILMGARAIDPREGVDTTGFESLPADETTLGGRALRERRTVFASMTDWPSATQAPASRDGYQHAAAAPLIVSDRALGTLVALRRADRAFSAEERLVIEECASQAAILMEHARVRDAERQRARELSLLHEVLTRTQKQLVERERLAALGELAAVVAHEVRNPLAIIFNALASLRRELDVTERADMLLSIVGEESTRLNRLVGDLLSFARPIEVSARPESIDQVIAEAIDAARMAVGAAAGTVELKLRTPLPLVSLDAELFRQAIINLILNALQARPAFRVLVEAGREEGGEGGATVRIDVTDRGPGIPASMAEQIFLPFVTSRAQGTGLGLAIVKRIVEAHRGTVSFRSDGDGTTFTVIVPAEP